MIGRREILAGLVGAAVLSSTGARAQSPLPRIGILANARLRPLDAFYARLHSLGYVEGRTVVIEPRLALGAESRYPAMAAELVDQAVDVILAWGTPAALAAKRATSRIPIVLVAGDVVSTGIVANLSRPEANITGFSALNAELEEKRLELLKEVVPRLGRVAVLRNTRNPLNLVNLETARRAASRLALSIEVYDVESAEDIDVALARMVAARPDAVLLASDLLLVGARRRIVAAMDRSGIPAIYPFREYVAAGGFIIYGANISVLLERAAGYVDRILKGAKPADLPVQQATAFELILNLKAAARLGLTLPPVVLARADEVIE
jgi:putative ABC transport system substrate-binding protein